MRRTKEDAEQTRKDLLDAAIQVFARQGYAATKLSDIAKEAGVTRGAIYHHFGNKKELFGAIHKEKMNPYFAMFEEVMSSNLSPLNKIRKFLTDIIRKAHTDINFAANQRFDAFRDIEFLDDASVRHYMRERGEHFFNRIVDVIKTGIETGEIRNTINPNMAAINLMAYVKGLVSLLIMEKDITMITDNTDELIDHVIQGL